jgi:hypothetical protein
MAFKKTIAIIGATGNVGSAIAKCLSVDNYRLLLSDIDSDGLSALNSSLKQVAPEAEIETVNCSREASWEADIIILAMPYEAGKEVAEHIREVAVGKVVISVSQPLHGNANPLANTSNSSAAEEFQRLLPHSKVVKTFNTTFALDNFTAVNGQKMMDAFIAGNNGEAVEIVSELLARAGFNPIPVGDLSMSRTLERIQSKLILETIKRKSNPLGSWRIYAF